MRNFIQRLRVAHFQSPAVDQCRSAFWFLLLTTIATCGFALVATPANAQQLQREIEPLGWTATGSEFLATTNVSGTATTDAGVSEAFSYTLLNVYNSNDGSVLSAFRQGSSTGPTRTAFQGAGSAPDGRTYRTANPVGTMFSGVLADDGRYIAVGSRTIERPRQTVECPTCRACTTTYQMVLFDGEGGQTLTLDEGTREGPSVTAGEPLTCVSVSVDAYWNDADDHVAIVMHEDNAGARFDSIFLYNLDGSGTYEVHDLVRLPFPYQGGTLRAEYEAMVARLPGATNRYAVMRDLGIMAVRMGDRVAGLDYLQLALAGFDDDPTITFWIEFANALNGESRAIRRARDASRDAGTALNRDLGVLYYALGDYEAALELVAPGEQLALDVWPHTLTGALRAYNSASALLRTPEAQMRYALALVQAGQATDGSRLIQSLDQTDPAVFAMFMRMLVIQDRQADVIQMGYPRLFDEPGNCGLYYAIGRAELEAGDVAAGLSLLDLARTCDPNDAAAIELLARHHWEQREMTLAAEEAQAYLRITPSRIAIAGATTTRIELASYRQRARSRDVVMISYTCTGSLNAGRTCAGTGFNASATAATNVRATLSASDDDGDDVGTAEMTYGTIQPGAEFEFRVTLPANTDVDEDDEVSVILNLTAGQGTATSNRLEVGTGL